MSRESRVSRLEEVVNGREVPVGYVVSRGPDDEAAQARIAEFEARGWGVHVINILVRQSVGSG